MDTGREIYFVGFYRLEHFLLRVGLVKPNI